MTPFAEYDAAIIGGGLAGLATSILLAKEGFSVALFEKDSYPAHKVCGEYVSLESWDFLCRLGLPLNVWSLPIIDKLRLTAPNGKSLRANLPLGGFGISRYKLDSELAALATASGVRLFENTKVTAVDVADGYTVHTSTSIIKSRICLGAFGKRSNLDVAWKRDWLTDGDTRLNNYVGVKYHVQTAWPKGCIGLHNFKDGYCGISAIEDGKHCLCYMTKASNLKASGNSIERMQETILFQNPHLKRIFQNSVIEPGFPVTISQISFSQKTKSENGVLFLGDAAGMITPLCGNGMSIALHTGKIAAALTTDYLRQNISRSQLMAAYQKEWEGKFATRLKAGRTIQRFFGSQRLSNLLVGSFAALPFLVKPIIRLTHGKPF